MSAALLLVVVSATGGVLLHRNPTDAVVDLELLSVAFAALAALVWCCHRGRGPDRRLLLAISGGLLVLAVIVPPRQSLDVWSYAMYGRIVVVHHASPYTHAAADYPGDPFARRVSRVWRHTPSVYGPVFSAVSSLGMWMAGGSALGARLFFQGLAALAVALALLVVERRTQDAAAVACLGLNPVIVISVVNGGHNDALVGLAVLAGVLLVGRRRPALAGLVLGLGVLVKVAAVLPLAAVGWWVWRRQGTTVAAALAGVALLVVVAGVAVSGGGDVLGPLAAAHHRFTGGSIWNGPRRWVTERRIAGGADATAAGRAARAEVARWADVAVCALAGVGVMWRLRRPSPAPAVAAAGVAFMLAGSYVYPWYLAWTLPVMVLDRRSRLTWLALGHAAVLYLASLPGPALIGPLDPLVLRTAEQRLQIDLYRVWLPLLEVVLIAVVVATGLRRPPPEGSSARIGEGEPLVRDEDPSCQQPSARGTTCSGGQGP